MNMQINRLQTGINYPGVFQLNNYFEKVGMVRAEVPTRRLGGTFTDIETESEMIRSAKMMIESAKAAQASLSQLLGNFADASVK